MHFPNVKGRREWIILAIWIAYIILLLFCKEPAKKLYGVCTLTDEPSPSRHSFQYAFSWATPTLFKHIQVYGWPHETAVWDHVLWDIVWDNCVWDNVWTLCIKGENLKFGHVILEPKMEQLCQLYLSTLFIVQNLKKKLLELIRTSVFGLKMTYLPWRNFFSEKPLI